MKRLIQSEGSRELIVVALTVACFGLLPGAHAVVPVPDGCYSNYTTAEGCNALRFLGAGSGNTGVGWYSLYVVGDGSYNTGVGAGTLVLNAADSNTAVGAAALLLNTGGHNNTAVGTDALLYNGSGNFNNALGAFALFNNIDGSGNNAFGDSALSLNIHGVDNTAIGDSALLNNDSTGNGFANGNTAVGINALLNNTDGASNVAIGDHSLEFNVSGFHNTVVGGGASGFNIVNGINNIYLGWGVSANGPFDESDAIRINDSAPQVGGTTSKVFIAGINGATVGGSSAPVIINANGQLGTLASSARFKKDIGLMGETSEAIFSLKPVTFHYKGDETRIPQFGLIAEEVAKVNSALILVDKEGKPYTVRYEQINAMLLNEFLKEHRTVQGLKSTVAHQDATIAQQQKSFESKLAEQQKRIEALTSGLEKVSARLELNRSRPQTVINNP